MKTNKTSEHWSFVCAAVAGCRSARGEVPRDQRAGGDPSERRLRLPAQGPAASVRHQPRPDRPVVQQGPRHRSRGRVSSHRGTASRNRHSTPAGGDHLDVEQRRWGGVFSYFFILGNVVYYHHYCIEPTILFNR